MNRWGLLILAAVVLMADQWTKHWVTNAGLSWPGGSRDILPGYFSLTLLHNTGGAFGILPHGTLGLAAAAALAVSAILLFVFRAQKPLPVLLALALGLPLGGALGNLWDRVHLGYVVDFLDFHVRHYQWPVFNVADSAICVGVFLLALRFWQQPAVEPQTTALGEGH